MENRFRLFPLSELIDLFGNSGNINGIDIRGIRDFFQKRNIIKIQLLLSLRIIPKQPRKISPVFQETFFVRILRIILPVIQLPDHRFVFLQYTLETGAVGAVLTILILLLFCIISLIQNRFPVTRVLKQTQQHIIIILFKEL